MGAWEELEWRERAGGLMYKVLNFFKTIFHHIAVLGIW